MTDIEHPDSSNAPSSSSAVGHTHGWDAEALRTKFSPRLLNQQLHEFHQRVYRDHVYGVKDWENYRIPTHRHRFQPGVFMFVALGFFWYLLMVLVIGVLTGLYHLYLVPRGAPTPSPVLSSAFSLTNFALALLLVFKTNSSYARWWECRIAWGQVLNFSRNYTRLMLAYMPEHKRHYCVTALRWTSAAPHVLRGFMRQYGAASHLEATHLLTQQELAYLSRWANPVVGVARVLSELVHTSGIAPQLQMMLEEQVSLFVSQLGTCERIYKTPIPHAYTRHTSRFIMLTISAMPVMMWDSAGWATLPLSVIITFLLLGIENIGVQLEEPCHVLPLEAMCKGIDGNLQELMRELREEHAGDIQVIIDAGLSPVTTNTAPAAAPAAPPAGPQQYGT